MTEMKVTLTENKFKEILFHELEKMMYDKDFRYGIMYINYHKHSIKLRYGVEKTKCFEVVYIPIKDEDIPKILNSIFGDIPNIIVEKGEDIGQGIKRLLIFDINKISVSEINILDNIINIKVIFKDGFSIILDNVSINDFTNIKKLKINPESNYKIIKSYLDRINEEIKILNERKEFIEHIANVLEIPDEVKLKVELED